MINPAEYRAALDRCLDERRDPLEEPDIQTFLDAHPEHLEGFARLREALAEISQAVPARPVPAKPVSAKPVPNGMTPDELDCPTVTAGPSRIELLATALVATAAGVALWFVLANPHSGNRGPQLQPGSRLGPPRILSASLREQPPLLHAAARYTVHESLVHTDTTLLEAYEHRSQIR